ncbi:MAG: hypothetical protein ACR5K7_02105 [Symbiopectobacterium sp.]
MSSSASRSLPFTQLAFITPALGNVNLILLEDYLQVKPNSSMPRLAELSDACVFE